MGCRITSNLFYCKPMNVGGLFDCFICNRADILDFYYATGDTKFSNITSLSVISGMTWYNFKVTSDADIFNEKSDITNNGTRFIKTLNMTFEVMDPDKRTTLKSLFDSRNFTIVFKNNTGGWFLLGDDFGSRISDYNATSATIKDGLNSYNPTIQAIGKYPLRSIDTAYVTQYILPFGVNYFTGGTTYTSFSCAYFVTHPLGDPVNILRTMDSVKLCPLI